MNIQSSESFCGSFAPPLRVNFDSEAPITSCDYTGISPEVVITPIIDALFWPLSSYSAPTTDQRNRGLIKCLSQYCFPPHEGAV